MNIGFDGMKGYMVSLKYQLRYGLLPALKREEKLPLQMFSLLKGGRIGFSSRAYLAEK